MIFVLDVGNTNTVLGVYEEDILKYHWRIETNRNKTEDEYGMIIKSLLQHEGLSFDQFDGIIISSVVPPIMFALNACVRNTLVLNHLLLDLELKRD